MASIGVRLPLTLDTTDGFGAIKTIRQMINQNLKMLILTNPNIHLYTNSNSKRSKFLFS